MSERPFEPGDEVFVCGLEGSFIVAECYRAVAIDRVRWIVELIDARLCFADRCRKVEPQPDARDEELHELAMLRKRLAETEAQAAAMREALLFKPWGCAGINVVQHLRGCVDGIAYYHDATQEWAKEPLEKISAALESTAGSALLARLETMRAELSRQSREAWMRGDIGTADRLAKLAGDQVIPSEHERQGA